MILAAMLSVGYAAAQYDEKVGINTETPSATLNVKTKNNTTSPKNLELENAGGTKLMTVLNGGNVGINTDAPAEKLHISNGKLLSEGNNSGVIIRRNGAVGPFVQFENPDKTIPAGVVAGTEPVSKWRIFNMGSSYGNSLRFWAYGTNESGAEVNLKSRIVIADNGNFGVGEFGTGTIPAEKLHIESGNVKINDLPSNAGGASDKVVVVDNTGVLKSVDRSTIGGNTGGTTLGALTGKIHKAPSITAGQWKTDGIFLFIQTSNDTIKLPNPADFTNKIISVNNAAGQGLNYAGEYSPHHTSTLDGGKGHILMSDGTDWYVIGGSY